MRHKEHTTHERIFGRASERISRTALTAYLVVALVVGLFFGSSPVFSDLIHGLVRNDGFATIAATHAPRTESVAVLNPQSSSATVPPLSRIATSSITRKNAPKLLFMTATYTEGQLLAFQKTMDCMKDICNAGWNVTIHIQSSSGFGYDHERYEEFRNRLYCTDMGGYIPLYIEQYKKIGFGLNSRHRLYMREHVNDFDYFSFAEEDMLLTISHLNAFLSFESTLKKELPHTHTRYTIGFLRYEDSLVDTERVSWEYFPDKIHVVDMSIDNPKSQLGNYVVTNNLNQAIFLMSRDQVLDLEERCAFLTDIGQNKFYRALRKAMDKDWKYISAGVSEWSSSFQQILQCGMRRVIPLDNYESFMIHHAVNKAQTRRLRKELLNARDLYAVLQEKKKKPIGIDEAYNTHVYEQYNLGLIDSSKFASSSKWSWNTGFDE